LLARGSGALAGGSESLSGARWRLAPAGSGGRDERDAMTLKRRITVLLIAGVVIAVVVGVYYMPHWQPTLAAVSKGGRRGVPSATDPVPVLAPPPRTPDVPVYLAGIAPAKALNPVTFRSQVAGKIMEILFTEGQDVPKGYVLAKIDPATYQAAFDQTVAKKAQDEAQLANAKLDLERYT